LGDEGGEGEDGVDEERAGAEEEVEEEEEGVDGEGADVEVVEGGGVGFCAIFAGFLRHGELLGEDWVNEKTRYPGNN